MSPEKKDHKPNIIFSVFQNKCPRCRRGELYQLKGAFRIKGLMKMHDHCTVCGQPYDMEPGFYYGTNMISYALAVLLSGVSFLLWLLIIGVNSETKFFSWLGANAVLLVLLQPPLMRLSRTVWLYFFVKYSSRWKEGDIMERFSYNKEQANNW